MAKKLVRGKERDIAARLKRHLQKVSVSGRPEGLGVEESVHRGTRREPGDRSRSSIGRFRAPDFDDQD